MSEGTTAGGHTQTAEDEDTKIMNEINPRTMPERAQIRSECLTGRRPVFPGLRATRRLLLFIVLGTSVAAQAATITVNSAADAGGICPGATCTLRQAISTAAPNDTINFAAGIATVSLTSGELVINKRLTIRGPGANQLSVQRSSAGGTPEFRIFNISGNVSLTLSGLTIANGFAPMSHGGGIYSAGALTINDSIISGNVAGSGGIGGGGIFLTETASLLVTNSTISGNAAVNGSGGGIFAHFSTVDIINSTISGNSAAYGGGCSNFSETLTVTNSTISGNSATERGGGIYRSGGAVNARNTIIAQNTAPAGPDFFGALTTQGYNVIGNTSGMAVVGNATDQLNANPVLGPLQDNGGPTMTHALLSGSPAIERGHSSGSITDQRGLARPVDDPSIPNVAGGDGSDIGAYEVQADQLPGCSGINRIVNNNNDDGAGSLRFVIAHVCPGSTITFAPNVTGAINLTSGELLINKSVTINGPGANVLAIQRSSAGGTPAFRIFNVSPATVIASLSGLTIANGNTTGNGGGIANAGTLTITASAISGNASAGGGSGGGGAIHNTGTLTVIRSTLSGNQASGQGGGVHNTGTLNFTNSTISGNSASGGIFYGGGIFSNGGMAAITNRTISGNTAYQGGGMTIFAGTVRAKNTIIAQNLASSSDKDVSGALTSEGFNLIGNSTGAVITPAQFSDQIGPDGSLIDPMLGPLQNNGGPTLTHALFTGSPAIDKGHSSGLPNDQRGVLRPVGSALVSGGDGGDIGAFEVAAPAPSPTPTPTPTATPTATPVPGNLANISTRLRVETGDNVLIAGIIVTGNAPKKIMIRAIGPSLPLADKLANPTLELRDGTGALLEANDDWIDSPNKQAIIDSTIPPSNNLEAAIVRPVPAGSASYTAIVRGVNNGTGIGVVEVYDLDTAADSKLANISTRGLVQTGDNVLIAGTIVVGQASQRVLIRAIGPSLPITGAMANPALELRDSSGTVLQANDNWVDSPDKQAIIDTTIPPTNDLESAMIAVLPANNASYTAIVRGVNETTGIAVVEVYALN